MEQVFDLASGCNEAAGFRLETSITSNEHLWSEQHEALGGNSH